MARLSRRERKLQQARGRFLRVLNKALKRYSYPEKMRRIQRAIDRFKRAELEDANGK